MAEPACIITGVVAGHPDACGDCDPCGAAYAVSAPVKRLIAEIIEWREKYADAKSTLDAVTADFDRHCAAPCPYCGE